VNGSTKTSLPAPPFRVQVVAQENMEYFRETVLGVRRYGFSTGRMVFADRWLDHELAGDMKRLVRRDGIQGIVAVIHTTAQERRFAGLGVPVVNVSNAMMRPRLPVVTQDDVAVGRLAAAHLQACGCGAFGFWGQTATGSISSPASSFSETVKVARYSRSCSLIHWRPSSLVRWNGSGICMARRRSVWTQPCTVAGSQVFEVVSRNCQRALLRSRVGRV
jgi:DNA-binding LacI/PurR family transcriptional regulator